MTISRIRSNWFALLAIALIGAGVTLGACGWWSRPTWNEEEIAMLRSLWIGSLPPLPPDPSNRFGDVPQAAALGHKLFFDTRLSSNGAVACSTCHFSAQLFQDGIPLAHGVGTTKRRTMTIIGTAYSPWLFWDGRKDSQWAQALGPLESSVEHGGNRTQYAHLIDEKYRSEYEAIFGALPAVAQLPASAGPVADPQAKANWDTMSAINQATVTRIYANMGKAIAAYERLLQPGPSRFDAYVEAVLNNDQAKIQATLSPDEVAGLKLFIGKANCTQCHNGPLFTDNHFHNTGVPAAPDLPADSGRTQGAAQVQTDEFNCLSQYSDAKPDECTELRFMTTAGEELLRAFKPPSLRNVAKRGPFMHAGQFATLTEVLTHYQTAPSAPIGNSELHPLDLSEIEIAQLIAFLRTLDGPINVEPQWLAAPVP